MFGPNSQPCVHRWFLVTSLFFCAAVVLTGLEKMAAEQDEMMKKAELELERVQEAAKETAQIIMGFGGNHLNVDLRCCLPQH